MRYTKRQTIDQLYKKLEPIDNLYQADCINWQGKTSDTKEPYSELIANELLIKIKEFDKISKVPRTGTYCIETHCQFAFDLSIPYGKEKNFAKRITGLHLPEIGIILDYQIPLQNTLKDENVGEIDLISFNEKTKTIHLIELKYISNKETLLRAILESFTYFKQINQAKLVKDFFRDCKGEQAKALKGVSADDIKVVPTVLVISNCQPFKELQDMELGNRPKLRALSTALGVNLFRIAVEVH